MSSQLSFLSIPPELRTQIYRHYLLLEDGYFFRSETGKLTTVNNEPIDLSLMYSCKLIAQEMQGMPLGLNLVTFSTSYSHDMRTRIGAYEDIFSDMHGREFNALNYGSKLLNELSHDELNRIHHKYPHLQPILEGLRDDRYYATEWGPEFWGVCHTVSRCFVRDVLQLMLTHGEFEREVLEWSHGHAPNPRDVYALPRIPWIIPDLEVVNRMASVLKRDLDVRRAKDQWKYRLSAASVAIRFLSSTAVRTRCQLRNILLHEDRASSVDPHTHAQGLIEFCQENPHLRIERRVSLWRAVWVGKQNYHGFRPSPETYLPSNSITMRLGRWIAEGLALQPAGMPAGSFFLVFDGESASEVCSRIFNEVVHRDAAWQAAIEICHARHPSTEALVKWRQTTSCIFTGFPEAMRDLAAGNSFIRFTFDIGRPWNVEQLMKQHPEWTDGQSWVSSWRIRGLPPWDPSPSLPTFCQLLSENIIQEGENSE